MSYFCLYKVHVLDLISTILYLWIVFFSFLSNSWALLILASSCRIPDIKSSYYHVRPLLCLIYESLDFPFHLTYVFVFQSIC